MSARSIRRGAQRERRRSARGRRVTRTAALGGTLLVGSGALGTAQATAAPFSVSNVNDAGTGSLRKAIEDADANPGADTITFGSAATGRIELQGPLPGITDAVTISGPGAAALTVDVNGYGGVLNVFGLPAPNQAVTISGLTLTGGDALNGGGIYNDGAELAVRGCVVTGNRADYGGGGILSFGGSLTIAASTISDNHVSGSATPRGGGVWVSSTDGDRTREVTISDSELSDNDAEADGAGAYFTAIRGDLLIERSTISGNDGSGLGGGLDFDKLEGDSSLTVDASTISGNSAIIGGAIVLGELGDSALIRNSTISGNQTSQDGGGIADFNYGSDPVTIANSTIFGNSASNYATGGGIRRTTSGETIRSSIIAGNSAGYGPDLSSSGAGNFAVGHSLIGDTTGATSLTASPPGSNKLNIPAQLGPLADNGGPTLTLLPALTSPAIDAGIAGGLTTDQRGLDRTIDGSQANFAGSDGTDMGAVERDILLEGAKIKAKKKQKQKGKKVVIKVKAGADEDVTAKAKGKIGKSKLKPVTKQVAAGTTATLKLKPKGKKAAKRIAKKLGEGKKLKAKLAVTIADPAGNSLTKKPKVKLKG